VRHTFRLFDKRILNSVSSTIRLAKEFLEFSKKYQDFAEHLCVRNVMYYRVLVGDVFSSRRFDLRKNADDTGEPRGVRRGRPTAHSNAHLRVVVEMNRLLFFYSTRH